jgi:GDSL-like Lipase/Acylhydrolase family
MRRLPHRVTVLLVSVAGLAVVAAVAIGVALLITPMQTVTVAGQVIKVGATAPRLSASGPGEVDLFGQSLPTVVNFAGPVRPRLALTQITIDSELANFAQGTSPRSATHLLGNRLDDGWTRYFGWEAAIAGLIALVLTGAVAGWRRLSAGATVRLLVAGLLITELVNLGAIVLAANSARTALHRVRSLNELVGSDPAPLQVHRSGPLLPGVQAVVIGDSTASGAGLPLVADPSRVDRACGRSADSYAEALARANDWKVMNLACNSATIRRGLLGSQRKHGISVPAQLGTTMRARDASVVVVSVGADDLQWAAIVRYCGAAPRCNDRASTAYFQQKLAAFSRNYFQLLTQLTALPGHPRVIINRYYDPFGSDLSCVADDGLTAAKAQILSSRLATLNKVLSTGAAEFGYLSVQPSFAGHQLCSPQPYVQAPEDPAPFHPTELGQLEIALADQVALSAQTGTQAKESHPGTAQQL